MMMPSIFNDNLFDDFFRFPFYNDKDEHRMEKKLYGHRAHNLMKTDIRERKGSYVLDIDLPGFKKDELTIELNDGYLTISAAKGLRRIRKKKKPDIISVVNVMPVPAREVSMLARM